MTELALPPWRDWIFGSFEDKSSDLEVHCYGLYQVSIPMHAGGHDDFVDSASVTLRPTTWYARYMYTCFRGKFETGRIYAGKTSKP